MSMAKSNYTLTFDGDNGERIIGSFSSYDEAWDAIVVSMPDEQKAKVAKQLENQPEQMTVYRGGGRASSHIDNSTSWTLEAGVAGFFATRLERERPVIVQAVINKSDVLNYDEVEQEILIAPNAPRTILNTWVLYGIQWLNNVHEDAGKMYQRIFANPERLATLDRLSGGDKAIKQHVCCQIFIAACLLLDSDVPEMMRDGLLRRIADAFDGDGSMAAAAQGRTSSVADDSRNRWCPTG